MSADRLEGRMLPIVNARPRVTWADRLILIQVGALIGGCMVALVGLLGH